MEHIAKNPTKAEIAGVIKSSEYTMAKWLKDSATGDIYCWPAEKYQHAHVAAAFSVEEYTKGFWTLD